MKLDMNLPLMLVVTVFKEFYRRALPGYRYRECLGKIVFLQFYAPDVPCKQPLCMPGYECHLNSFILGGQIKTNICVYNSVGPERANWLLIGYVTFRNECHNHNLPCCSVTVATSGVGSVGG